MTSFIFQGFIEVPQFSNPEEKHLSNLQVYSISQNVVYTYIYK